jgi:uncharacterized membrane protein YfcA
LLDYLFPILIVFAGSALQGSFGFGLGLLAAPLLVLYDPVFVPGPLITNGLILTLFLAIRERKAMDFSGVRVAIIGRIPGVLLGSFALTVVSARTLGIGFGVLILAGVAMSAGGRTLRPTTGTLLGAGFFSGFMGTTTGVGGPPLALVYQGSGASRFRATMFGYFTVGISISIVSLVAFGLYGTREAMLSAQLLPGSILGYFVSGSLVKRIDDKVVRPAVLLLSAVAAIFVILRQVV